MATKKPKTTPWNKIKAEYLAGATPKELAEKFGLTAKQIHDKSNKDKWTREKASIGENIKDDIQERIKDITDLAITKLKEIINKDETRDTDRINAIKAILDISGLKSQKIEQSNIDTTPFEIKIIK